MQKIHTYLAIVQHIVAAPKESIYIKCYLIFLVIVFVDIPYVIRVVVWVFVYINAKII